VEFQSTTTSYCDFRGAGFSLGKGEKGYSFKIKYVVHSKSFLAEFKEISYKQSFGAEHVLTAIMNDLEKAIVNYHTCELNYGSGNERHPMTVEMWKNKYKAFALIKPNKKSPIVVGSSGT